MVLLFFRHSLSEVASITEVSFAHNASVFVAASKHILLVFGLIFLSFLFICNKHHVLLISVLCLLHDYPQLAHMHL